MYVIIVGCGRVGAELARLLSKEGNDVVVIDKSDSSFARLGEAFNGIMITGDGVSPKTLQDAGIKKANIFCALTSSDNANIMASQVAKGIFQVPRVIARIYDPQRASIYKTFGLDVLSETTLFASMIRDKIVDRNFSSYIIESNELGLFEFTVTMELAGKTAEEVNIPKELMVVTIKKENETPRIPDSKTKLVLGDSVVSVVRMPSLKKIKKALNLPEAE